MRPSVTPVNLVTVAVALVLVFAAWYLEDLHHQRHLAVVRANVQDRLALLRGRLEGNLNSDVQLAKGLISVITLNPDLDQGSFERAVRPLFSGHTRLRNIGAAPGMVIRLMYPMQGNEAAVGLDYRATPVQFEAAEQARWTRQIILAGPLNLVQGGQAVIARMPVFTDAADGGERFWGLVSAAIDVERLFRDSGLVDETLPIAVAIRGRDGAGPQGEIFFGPADLFSADPVLAAIELPVGSWQLAAVPKDGWPTHAQDIWPWRIGFLLLAMGVLGAMLAFGRAVRAAYVAQEQAESARGRLSATLEKTRNVAVQWYDAQGRVTYWNPASERLYGWPAEEALGKTLDQLIHTPQEAAEFLSLLGRIAATGEQIGPAEYRTHNRAGESRWVEATVYAIPGHDRDAPIFVRTDLDITERRRREQEIAAVKQQLQATLDAVPDLMFELDAQGRYLGYHSPRKELLATPPEDLLGKKLTDVLPPEAAAQCMSALQETRDKGFSFGRQLHLDLPIGRHWFELSVSAKSAAGDQDPHFIVLSRDITERRLAEEAVRDSENMLRIILDNVDAYIYLKDTQGRYLFANRPVRELWQADMEQIIGSGDERFFDGPTTENIRRNDRRVLDHGEILRTEETNRIPGTGRTATYLSTKLPLRREDDAIYALCGISVDISERKRVEIELNQYRHHLEDLVSERTEQLAAAKEAAETANVAKSAFLANMSHEIRTPLNAIIGMAHLIRRSGIEPQQAERLDKLENAGAHLLEVINTILDLSKIEAGKFDLTETEVRVEDLVRNVASMLHDRVQAKGIRLVVETRPLPRPLLGDPTRLQQALLNYATNAVKFTDHGGITLRALPQQETLDSVLVRFEVQDTGIGIAPDILQRLFSAFEQADNTTTRRHGGTGLGLAITRKLAELMGGEAGAASTPGAGSTFWFTVPLRKGGIAAAPGDAVPGDSAEQTLARKCPGGRILVVEDEPVNQEITAMFLDTAAQVADVAADGVSAVALAESNHYDVILMDMQMPRMDGLEAARRIRLLPRHAQTPIIAMTANAFADDRQQCMDAGMNDFLTKPVNPDVLYRTLLKWIRC